jgi:exopolysaccharide biosynthesis polyprenyl glycosylphosphotransferase
VLSCLLVDVAMLAAAAAAASVTSTSPQPLSVTWFVLFSAATIGCLAVLRGYAPRMRLEILEELRHVLTTTAVAAMLMIAAHELTSGHEIDGSEVARLWAYAFVYLAAGRTGLFVAQRRARRSSVAGTATLIIGAGRVGHLTASRLLENPELGLRPIGFLDKDPVETNGNGSSVPVLGASWDLEKIVAEHDVGHVVITFSSAPHHVLLGLLSRCEQLGVRVSAVPRLFERLPTRLSVTHVGGLPLLELRPSNPRGIQYSVKYAVDRVVAAIAIVVLSPVLVAITIAVLVSLGRPVLYRQRRVGRDGRPFDMLKFRSMRPSGPESDELSFSPETAPGGVEGTDRRTRMGSFLRRSSLDELAQLINVLRGEMSLVGPRPERPEFVSFFNEHVYRYDERHRVKSGVTGWAQINGLRGKTSLADRVEWDNYYIENFSLWLDLKIILLTVPEVFRGRGKE